MYGRDRREKFRVVLEGARRVYQASVYDPITARLAADLGYEIGMFSGSVASPTILGAPDIVVLTLTEFVAQALRIYRAGDLPLPEQGSTKEVPRSWPPGGTRWRRRGLMNSSSLFSEVLS